MIVTAGGSAYFDLVAAGLGGAWLPGHQLRVILRSGAYVSPDNGLYQVKAPFTRIPGALEAALEIWAQVTPVQRPPRVPVRARRCTARARRPDLLTSYRRLPATVEGL